MKKLIIILFLFNINVAFSSMGPYYYSTIPSIAYNDKYIYMENNWFIGDVGGVEIIYFISILKKSLKINARIQSIVYRVEYPKKIRSIIKKKGISFNSFSKNRKLNKQDKPYNNNKPLHLRLEHLEKYANKYHFIGDYQWIINDQGVLQLKCSENVKWKYNYNRIVKIKNPTYIDLDVDPYGEKYKKNELEIKVINDLKEIESNKMLFISWYADCDDIAVIVLSKWYQIDDYEYIPMIIIVPNYRKVKEKIAKYQNNIACCFALKENPEKSIYYLKKYKKKYKENLFKKIENDKDLNKIRDKKEFKKFLRSL